MKETILTMLMYLFFALIAFVSAVFSFFYFGFNDIVQYYNDGVLKEVFLISFVAIIILPFLFRKKINKKWILPVTLSAILIILPVCYNGIVKFIEDDIRVFSTEKWNKQKRLRIYMIDYLQTHEIKKGETEERVVSLLGEPDNKRDENKIIEYYIHPGYIDPIILYIKFENGEVIEMGKYYS